MSERVREESVGEADGRERGPFARLAPERMRRLLTISGALTLVLFIALAVVDARIKANGGPGIIGLEVAGSATRAAEILGQWGESGRTAARVSLILDYPFMIAYAIFFSAACTAMGRRLRARAEAGGAVGRIARHLATPAPWLGWAFILAAILDAIENFALLRVIDFKLTWAGTAQIAASPKLAIFGAGLFFLIVSTLLTADWTRFGRGVSRGGDREATEEG